MNKFKLMALACTTTAITMVGCTSTPTPEVPETTSSAVQSSSVQQDATSAAQQAGLESSMQNGVAAQPEAQMNPSAPVQAAPLGQAPDVNEQPAQ